MSNDSRNASPSRTPRSDSVFRSSASFQMVAEINAARSRERASPDRRPSSSPTHTMPHGPDTWFADLSDRQPYSPMLAQRFRIRLAGRD